MTPAILLDSDPGIDDALALLYLASMIKTGQAELAAVGSVHGNAPADVCALNALRVLESAGLTSIPVAVGAAGPLVGEPGYAPDVHGTDGMGNSGLPAPAGRPVEISAPEQIIRLTRARPGELSLVALGPLTNLAIALLLDPGLTSRVRQVVIMGGALEHPGNSTAQAEANIWHDPEAAELVLAASWPAPVTLVPLDATYAAPVDAQWLDTVAATDTPAARLATAVLGLYADYYERFLGYHGAVIHDALAVMLALDPALADYIERPVYVELAGQRLRGATTWDARFEPRPDARPVVRVATRPDAAAFHQRLLDSLR
jgi:purine nucleosidase